MFMISYIYFWIILKHKMLTRLKRRKQQQKLLLMGDAGQDDDKISKLPDPLIHHILSFLPIKFAARTSTLSKRWRNVWVFTPVLDFRQLQLTYNNSEKYRVKTENFLNSVDRMLSFRDNMPNIEKLHLQIQREFDESRVNGWISTVIRRKVEELFVEFPPIDYFTFPPCLFTCDSLTVLELNMEYLKLPKSISFPRLKILRLLNMAFKNDESIQRLFSNCPALEELILKNCNLDSLHILSICVPTLKFLSIEDFYGMNEYLYENSIMIYAPSLLSLKYDENVAGDFNLSSFPSLVDADIRFFGYAISPKTEEETGYAASKLIAGLLNVKFLKLSGETFEVLSFADDLLTTSPQFYNLIRLEVTSEFSCSNKTIFEFLQIMHNLESLVFAMFQGFEQGLSEADKCWTPSLVPQCLLLHLKSVEFLRFSGHQRELNAVQLFLKNAGILEMMTVIFYSILPTNMKNMIRELLEMLPRSSISCVIKVS